MNTQMQRPRVIRKVLSANDTGETGAHQAGMLIPKTGGVLEFFPPLGSTKKNPRVQLTFFDEGGHKWKFYFIYYNNSLFGGTRNEYRLTWMTEYINANRLKAGDVIYLRRDDNDINYISYRRSDSSQLRQDILRLGSGWKIHQY